jgi:phosphoribosyl 1,2-cyclic phosphodiesterase
MRLWMLGSGSRGNAVLLESGSARILIDAGFPVRVLQTRLRSVGIAPESISHCVITHEHTDHVRGAASAAAKWGWTLHASRGTLRGAPDAAAAGAIPFTAGDTLAVDGFALQTVATPHDANESIAIVATANGCGTRTAICYDLGHGSDAVCRALVDVELLVLEANHDEAMLRVGPYPPFVSARIGGRHGHLSNRAAAALARGAVSKSLRQVVLAHLSEKCNTPTLALDEVGGALGKARYRGALQAAAQDAVLGPITPFGSGVAAPRAQQLQLF